MVKRDIFRGYEIDTHSQSAVSQEFGVYMDGERVHIAESYDAACNWVMKEKKRLSKVQDPFR